MRDVRTPADADAAIASARREALAAFGDGTLYVPGEAIIMTPGSAHDYSVPDGADLLMLVIQQGFDIVETPS